MTGLSEEMLKEIGQVVRNLKGIKREAEALAQTFDVEHYPLLHMIVDNADAAFEIIAKLQEQDEVCDMLPPPYQLQKDLLEVFEMHGLNVGVGIIRDGVTIISQDERVDAHNSGPITAYTSIDIKHGTKKG